MKKLSFVLSVLYGTTLLHGCSSTTSESRNWRIEPFQSVQHATNRPDGYYQLGRHYQGQNRLELAAGAYRKALAIDPNFFEAHNGLGTIYASQGKYEQALAAFNSAIAKAPDAAHVYNNIGYLKFLGGHYDEAVTAFSRATALDPGSQKAWNNLGMALARSGEPMKSNQAFAKAIETSPSAQPAAASASNQVAAASGTDQSAPTLAVPKNRGVIDYTAANRPERNNAERLNADNTREDKPAHPAPAGLAQPAAQPPFAVIEAPNSSAMPVVMVNGSPYSAIEKVTVAKVQSPSLEMKPSSVASNTKQASSAAPVLAAEKTEPKIQRNSAIEKGVVAKVQPLPLEVKPSSVDSHTKQANSAVPVSSAEKTEPKTQRDSAIEKVAVAKVKPLPPEVKPSPVASNTKQPSSAAPVLTAGKTEPKTQRATTSLKHVDLKESLQKATPSRAVRTAAIPKERQFKLEVSNGNGTHRLATRISSMLSARGLPRASLSNHTSFKQARTVIHYRKGYLFEAARLSRHLRDTRQAIMLVESRNLPAKTDVRLVLGKDLSGKLNWMDKARPMTVASR